MTRPTRRWPEAVGASAGPVRTSARTLENGLSELYVNALARDGGEVSALMRVFTEAGAYDEARFPETSRVKRRLRETEEGREDMGSVIEEIRAECRAGGRLEAFDRLVRAGLVDAHAAAALLEIDPEEVERMLA